jgi:lipopolysaccharide assembly outer membrane protein LptD (OstA)
LAWLLAPRFLLAQYQPPASSLSISATTASTWTSMGTACVQLAGSVQIDFGHTHLTAQNAVVWIRKALDGQPGEQSITIALLDHAIVKQPEVTRSGDRLLVDARVNGPIRITAETHQQNLSDSQTYRAAYALFRETQAQATGEPYVGPTSMPSTFPTSAPSTRPAKVSAPVMYHAKHIESAVSPDGKMALVLSGGIALTRQQPDGSYLEMQADRAVVFTSLDRLSDIGKMKQVKRIEDAITAAYLEGDVRIVVTPSTAHMTTKGEERLEANRVYYEFTTDRAILTDAIIHAYDPQRGLPVIVRANAIRQLSQGEWRANNAEVTTSNFAAPSFSVRADKAYIRDEPTGNPLVGDRITFEGHDVQFRAFDLPFFYLPYVGGSMTEHGFPMRQLSVGQSSRFGTSFESEWGLFEALGAVPPQDLDASFRVDAFSLRGPAVGLDADYTGGIVSETTKKAWNFEGNFRSYFLPNDTESDDLGRKRNEVKSGNDFRGMVFWQNQYFLPDDWQVQMRTGWTSDATFMEQYFEDRFNDGLPMETSLYLKKQHDTEALTFLATVQPNNVVTDSDLLQEQFEVQRLPELGYHRIGDSFAEDHLTSFSDATVGRYDFNVSGTSLGDQGFVFKKNVRPGQPSLGLVGATGLGGAPGVTENYTDRIDLRQEIDMPFAIGQIRVLPYVSGRYTGYSDTPDYNIPGNPETAISGGGTADRIFATTGIRFNTQFWNIDNDVHSDLFDLHRVRHIIEPELHLFASASNHDPSDLWIYDESVDRLWDVQAAQIALRQRWQTKRGGPGNWRTVDFFTLDLEANFFTNQPPPTQLVPAGFRGLFFSSMPEMSTPRNSINADATWRISDETIMLGDAEYNLDEQSLATASIGLVARRAERVNYLTSVRYIKELNSSIGTVAATYEMTPKYSIGFSESFDFSQGLGVYSSFSIQRKFDRFFAIFTVFNNSADASNGVGFAIYPEGLGAGFSSDALGQQFSRGR